MKWSCAKITGLQKPRQTRIHTGHSVSHQWAHACVFDLGAAHSPSFQAFQSMKAHLSPTKKTHTKPQNPQLDMFHNKLFRNFFLFPLVSSEGPVWLQFCSCRWPWSTTRQWGSRAKTSGLAFAWWWWWRHWWCITFSVTTLPRSGALGIFLKPKNLEVDKKSHDFS